MAETKQITHFSHRHPLLFSAIGDDDAGKDLACSGCELDLFPGSSAYACTKKNCNFILHDSCTELPQQIRHKSHKHPLILFPSPPYGDGEFTCNACGNSGQGFTFHCSTCNFDLDVECASLPESEDRDDHKHPLSLFYDFPGEAAGEEGNAVVCVVCNVSVAKGCWFYCCMGCNFGTHLACVDIYDRENS